MAVAAAERGMRMGLLGLVIGMDLLGHRRRHEDQSNNTPQPEPPNYPPYQNCYEADAYGALDPLAEEAPIYPPPSASRHGGLRPGKVITLHPVRGTVQPSHNIRGTPVR